MKSYKKLILPIQKGLRENKKQSVGLLLLIVSSLLMVVAIPMMMERGVNYLARGEMVPGTYLALFFLVLVLSGVSDSGKEVLLIRIGQRMGRCFREEMVQALGKTSLQELLKQEPGEQTHLFVNDVDTLEDLFSSGVVGMVVDLGKIIVLVIAIFVKNTGLGLVVLLVLPGIFYMTRCFQKKALCAQQGHRKALGKMNRMLVETKENIRTIHRLGQESYQQGRYRTILQSSYECMEKANFCDAIYSPIVVTIRAVLVFFFVLGVVGKLPFLRGSDVTPGALVALVAYLSKVFAPLENIGMEIQSIQSAQAGIERINAFLNREEGNKKEREHPRQKRCEEIKNLPLLAEHLSFFYDQEKVLFDNLSFQVNQGETLLVVGRTGTGKSTLCKLLMGLMEPREGQIFLWGENLDSIKEKDRRHLYGYVPQEFFPVQGSILEQVTLFDPQVTKKEVKDALMLVGLWEKCEGLSQGVDTWYEEGVFSYGERQLLSLARAIVLDPPLLILDEMGSHMDVWTEEKVLKALEEVMEHRASIMVTHRARPIGRILEIE